MSGIKGRSGRKPSPETKILRMLDTWMPELYEVVYLDAVGARCQSSSGEVFTRPPNPTSAIALIERRQGKPRQAVDMNNNTTITLEPSIVLSAARESRLIEAEWMQRDVAEEHLRDNSEEECRMALPSRIVSCPSEKLPLYPSEVDITYENGGGI